VKISRVATLLAGLLVAASAMGQDWPSRPIRFIMPFAAGGGADLSVRMMAPALAKTLGQPVVVENIVGANAVIGSNVLAKAAPDGYTFLMTTPSHTINPLVVAKLPYDSVNDFAPVGLFLLIPYVFTSSNAVPAKNVKELIAYAKAHPDELTFASSGPGSGARLVTELFKMTAGIEMVHVPYKSSSLSMPDMIAGRVSVVFDQEPTVMPFIRSGKLRGLAVTSPQRLPAAPEIPTMEESGLPNFTPTSWSGIFAPKGTPPEIIARMSAAIHAAITTSPLKEQYQGIGTIPVGGTPAEFATFLREDSARWKRVAARIHLQPE
jgi:tripartite-type tricarboxylate transporter receptor subunit TctC